LGNLRVQVGVIRTHSGGSHCLDPQLAMLANEDYMVGEESVWWVQPMSWVIWFSVPRKPSGSSIGKLAKKPINIDAPRACSSASVHMSLQVLFCLLRQSGFKIEMHCPA
jgi:hypothetical protein